MAKVCIKKYCKVSPYTYLNFFLPGDMHMYRIVCRCTVYMLNIKSVTMKKLSQTFSADRSFALVKCFSYMYISFCSFSFFYLFIYLFIYVFIYLFFLLWTLLLFPWCFTKGKLDNKGNEWNAVIFSHVSWKLLKLTGMRDKWSQRSNHCSKVFFYLLSILTVAFLLDGLYGCILT